MPQYATSAATSPSWNGHLEGSEYHDGPNEEQDYNGKTKQNRPRPKQDTCKGIFVVTQFWVICFAVVLFAVVVVYTANKYQNRETVETKETVNQEDVWFKFAICLRPFMTTDVMKEMYAFRLNRTFKEHLASLKYLSEEEKKTFMGEEIYFDNTLEPIIYQNYLKHVHPRKEISHAVLWEFQNVTIREAFEEFLVNDIDVGNAENGTGDMKKVKQGATLERYTTLLPPKNGSKLDQPILTGEYLLSPMYLGCLSINVNGQMAKKPMEISIKFRPIKKVRFPNFHLHGILKDMIQEFTFLSPRTPTTLFKAADIFVLNINDTFTEIPIIKRHAKYSVMATSRERLLVKSSMYQHENTASNCNRSEKYDETACRQDCIYEGLLVELNCTLPWMERFLKDNKFEANFTGLQMCTDLDGDGLVGKIKAQESFLSSKEIGMKTTVEECLQKCLKKCDPFLVHILSLGSKSIGSNYGVSLTISPAMDVVTERFNYSLSNMVSELCASISFLLGISGIAIYDWLVAFTVWVSIKLGLYVPEEEEEEEEECGGSLAPSPPSARRSSSVQPAVGGQLRRLDSSAAGLTQSGEEGQIRRGSSLPPPGDQLGLSGDPEI